MRHLTHSVILQLLLGASLKAFVPMSGRLEPFLSWSTFSVVGLFLTVGLQLEPQKFSRHLILCLKVVLATTFIPILIFYFHSRSFGLSALESMTVSAVLVTTGTGVTIQTLSNLGKLHTLPGQFLALVSALDDIPAAMLMGLLLLSSPSVETRAPFPLGLLAGTLLSLALLWGFRNREFPRRSLFQVLFVLLFGLGLSRILELYHVSLVMGGLLSGGILAIIFGDRLRSSSELLEKGLRPVLSLYMISIGMKLSPSGLGDMKMIFYALTLIVVAVATKWICTWFLVRRETLLFPKVIAWGMVPRGIPGLAFATAGLQGHLISFETFTLLILIVSVTTWIGLFGLESELRKVK